MRPTFLLLSSFLAVAPVAAQQIFDPFAGPKRPDKALSDGPAPSPTPTPEPPKVELPPIGFTWWNDGPAMVEKGSEAYRADRFLESELWYQDARLTAEKDAAPIEYNQGLALARQGKWEEAVPTLSSALDRSTQDAELRTDLYYSRGTARLHEAQEATVALLAIEESGKQLKKKEREQLESARTQAIQLCFDSIDDLGRALERRPKWDDAVYNRAQAQNLLMKLTKDPPPDQDNQQQQQQQNGDGDPDQNQDPNQGDQQPKDQQDQNQDQEQQQQDQQQNGEQDQQQQGDQQQQDQQESSSPSEPDESEQQGGQGQAQQGQPAQMTPEQAAALLEMLGSEQSVRLRLRTTDRPRPAKDW